MEGIYLKEDDKGPFRQENYLDVSCNMIKYVDKDEYKNLEKCVGYDNINCPLCTENWFIGLHSNRFINRDD